MTRCLVYLHRDHLGSATVTSYGTVSSNNRANYDAWGKVTSGGLPPTTLSFTGQKLDGTGLLDYHARMYDPVLGRFISPDPIAPKRDDPQTRNRYSYVLNNPLKYTDPTGHCTEQYGEVEICQYFAVELGSYGLNVLSINKWRMFELATVLSAVKDFAAMFGGTSLGVKRDRFKNSITNYGTFNVFFDRLCNCKDGSTQAYTTRNGSNIYVVFLDLAFKDGSGRYRMDDTPKVVTVHELAHVWDATKDELWSDAMMAATGASYKGLCWPIRTPLCFYDPGDESPASKYGTTNHEEDYAEAVAASIYPNFSDFLKNGKPRMEPDSKRARFVRELFATAI